MVSSLILCSNLQLSYNGGKRMAKVRRKKRNFRVLVNSVERRRFETRAEAMTEGRNVLTSTSRPANRVPLVTVRRGRRLIRRI